MTQEEAFHQSILEAPDDDLPRLAYADWLEEQGNPRSEFIHVQIDLARLDANDPRRNELRQREDELLQRHAWEWAEPLGNRISEFLFERGFISRVATSLEVSANEIQWLLQQAPIHCLRDVGQVCELQGVRKALPHLTHVTGLEFWGLYAFDNELLWQIVTAPQLRNLRTLILHHHRNGALADDDVIVEGVVSSYREKLEELAVNVDSYGRGPSARVVDALVRSPALKNLRRLTLSHAELDLRTVNLLARSWKLPRLKHLNLSGCRLSREVWNAVLRLVEGRSFHSLRLAGADVVEEEETYIGGLEEVGRYQEAFEEAVEVVEWEADFLQPLIERSWKGFSWEKRQRTALLDMHPFVRCGDFGGLEAAYRKRCVRTGGEAVAREIDALRFDACAERLRPGLERALESLRRNEGQMIVYRQMLNTPWEGKYQVQEQGPPTTLGHWEEGVSSSFIEDFSGTTFPEADAVYRRHPLEGSIHPSGPALYLIARALAAFGRMASRYDTPVPLCFSCGCAVFRM